MINVIGLGYIGLPTALVLAKSGNEVVGTDINKEIVQKLQSNHITFEEEGLDELFSAAISNNIEFSNDYKSADTYIITVPTPYEKNNKKINAEYVIDATKQVLEVCKEDAIIVIESTISPGTIDRFIRPLFKDYKYELGRNIHLVHAPERILPGNMIYELKNNSRTIGADSPIIAEKVKKVYESFCNGEIVTTDIRTAEMTKVIENTFRDINIAFANELTNICHQDNLDVYEIIRIANKHPRVNILNPGPGVGGHCIPVDPWFLVGDYPRFTRLITAAREINDSMPRYVLNRVYEIMRATGVKDISRVGIYGLTYKADVDDIRESPTLQLLDLMKQHLAEPLSVYDPMVEKRLVDSQIMDFNEFLNSTDLVIIMVGHQHIKEHKTMLSNKIVFDTQNIFDSAEKL